jgi:hypothetical protein
MNRLQSTLEYGRAEQKPRIWRGVLVALGVFLCWLIIAFVSMVTEPVNWDPQPEYVGMRMDDVIQSLGQPTYSQQFPLGEARDFRDMALRERFDLTDATVGSIPIKEHSWRGLRSTLTVWFYEEKGQWVAVEAIRGHNRMKWPEHTLVPTTSSAP